MDPPDNIMWTFDGMEVDTGSETAGNFTLSSLTIADYGVYTCNASNEFGSNSDTLELIPAGIYDAQSCSDIVVFTPLLTISISIVEPMLTPQFMDIEVEVLTQLMLTANVSAFNLVIDGVTWNRNDSIIENENGFTLSNSSLDAPPAMVTLILDVTSPNRDSGIYTVTVSNPAGSDTSTFNVTVTGGYTKSI